MSQPMTYPLKEIRINSDYAAALTSDYKIDPDDISIKEDSIATSEPKIERRILPTRSYLKKITQSLLTVATVLPPNCRFIEKLSQGHIVIIEEPPCLRTVLTSEGLGTTRRNLIEQGKITKEEFPEEIYGGDSSLKKFNLALPYLIFILYIKNNSCLSGEVFGRVSRLTGLSDYLFKMPFNNISSDQYICFGDQGAIKCKSLNQAVEHGINTFWNATFNTDYTYNRTAYKDVPIVNNYFEWHSMSQKDPMFIYDIPWVKYPNSLAKEIEKMKDHIKSGSGSDLSFAELEDMFSRPMPTGKIEVPFAGSKAKQELFYDIAQGIYISHNSKDLFIHVGDNFTDSKNRRLFISSFIGFSSSDHIRYLEIQREDKKRFVFKFTKKIQEFIYNQIESARFTDKATTKNGVEIKTDDIVKIKGEQGRTAYGKVQFIRLARQYGHQAKIGNSFHIVENMEGEIFKIDNAELDGIKLNKKSLYLAVRGNDAVPLTHVSLVRYEGVDVNSSGNMHFTFKFLDKHLGTSHNIPFDSNGKEARTRVYSPEQYVVCEDPVYRCTRKILTLKESNKTHPKNGIFYTRHGVGVEKNYRSNSTTIDEAEKYFIKGEKFVCNSYDLNLEFNIGEKVIAVDWQNPLEMLMVKTIIGFKVDKDSLKIFFILEDKNQKISQVEYVNLAASFVNVGIIRKITNEFNGIKAGTKIISQGTRVAGFPKKDVNIIIGFITDSGVSDPLVLCSNCLTLWFSDLEQFKLIPYKGKGWDKHQHAAIDISKIKYQAGDIIQGVTDVRTNGGWFVWNNNSSRQRVTPMEYMIGYPDSYGLDGKLVTHTLLDCIPNPRLTPGQLTEMGLIRAFPNCHGGFTPCEWSQFLIPNDPRSLMNV